MFLIVSTLFVFVFGAVIGSFLNVVIHRVPIGQSVVMPPSHCPTCDNNIAWYDNIPILSWALLGGECRHCKTSISARYAAVEGLTGVLAALLWIKIVGDPISKVEHWVMLDFKAVLIPFFLYFAFVAVCVAIAFIDLEHLIIPHELSIPTILIGIGASFLLSVQDMPVDQLQQWPPITPSLSILGAIIGAMSVIAIFVVYFIMRGVAGMGGGDVTLMAMAGAWLGWPAIIFIFFAASIQGLIAVAVAKIFGLDDFLHDANEIFDEDEDAENKEDAEDDEADSSREDAGDEQDDSEDLSEDESASAAKELEETSEETGSDSDEEEEGTGDEEADATSEGEDASETQVVDVTESEEEGPLAIPFGPFIVLSALEHLYLGPMLPDAISMAYMYFY